MLLTDIDDRKVAEAAVRASEQDCRQIIDSIPGLVWTMTATGEVELVNQQMLDYFGRTPDQLADWALLVHPDDRPSVVDRWHQTIETGQPYDIQHRLRRADGVYRWFQSRGLPQRDGKGSILRWYNLLTDIDDGKRAEEALRSDEHRLRQILHNIPGPVSIMNAAGELEFVSRQSIQYFGKTAEELNHWATSDGIHPEDLPRMIQAWKQAIETGQPIEVEHRSRRVDGVYRWFLLRGRPQRDLEGRVIRWYNLVTDIDDRKRAEEKVQRSEAYLSEAQHLSHTGSFGCKLPSGEMFWSEETFRIFGYSLLLQRTAIWRGRSTQAHFVQICSTG
jgi:PAS domain S-box-containing protein